MERAVVLTWAASSAMAATARRTLSENSAWRSASARIDSIEATKDSIDPLISSEARVCSSVAVMTSRSFSAASADPEAIFLIVPDRLAAFSPPSTTRPWISATISLIRLARSAWLAAKLLTSAAMTAKPFPDCPECAASIAAFIARRFVRSANSFTASTTSEMPREDSDTFCMVAEREAAARSPSSVRAASPIVNCAACSTLAATDPAMAESSVAAAAVRSALSLWPPRLSVTAPIDEASFATSSSAPLASWAWRSVSELISVERRAAWLAASAALEAALSSRSAIAAAALPASPIAAMDRSSSDFFDSTSLA